MIEGKVWGRTLLLLQTPLIAVHRIWVEPNSFCSWHCHRSKWNAFFVMDGRLHIKIKKAYGLLDTTTLEAGDFTSVAPGLEHRFETDDLRRAFALEIYYTQGLDPEDIVRSTNGGINANAPA